MAFLTWSSHIHHAILYQSATRFSYRNKHCYKRESPATCTFVPFCKVSTACTLGNTHSSTFGSTYCTQPVQSRKQMLPSQGLHSYSCIPTSKTAEGVSQVNAADCKRHSRTRLESREALLPEHSPRAAADPDAAAQKQTWDTRGTTGHSKEEQNMEQPGAPGDVPPAYISINAVPYPLTKNTKAICFSPASQTSSNLCCWVMHQHRDEILMPGQELVRNLFQNHSFTDDNTGSISHLLRKGHLRRKEPFK